MRKQEERDSKGKRKERANGRRGLRENSRKWDSRERRGERKEW